MGYGTGRVRYRNRGGHVQTAFGWRISTARRFCFYWCVACNDYDGEVRRQEASVFEIPSYNILTVFLCHGWLTLTSVSQNVFLACLSSCVTQRVLL